MAANFMNGPLGLSAEHRGHREGCACCSANLALTGRLALLVLCALIGIASVGLAQDAAKAAKPLPTNFRSISLGMGLEQAKEALKEAKQTARANNTTIRDKVTLILLLGIFSSFLTPANSGDAD